LKGKYGRRESIVWLREPLGLKKVFSKGNKLFTKRRKKEGDFAYKKKDSVRGGEGRTF